MADDVLSQVVAEVKASPYKTFALQFDESTDVSSCAVLLGYIRYVHEAAVKEEFLLCENLTTTTRGKDVFNVVNGFMEKHGLDWNRVHQVSVDGCPAMMGGNIGFRGFVQRANANTSVDHCIIHRYSLASKTLPDSLKTVFNQAVEVVNYIKAKDLNSRVFKELCKEMGEKHQALLFHTEVRWLSRGKVFTRLVELRQTVQVFLEEKKGSDLAHHFSDPQWIARLYYLSDIFAEVNKGNLSIQGKNVTVIDAKEVVAAMIARIKLWSKRVGRGVVAQFATLDQYVDTLTPDQQDNIMEGLNVEMADHLSQLATKLEHYFPDLDTSRMQ